jgi:hypothetical protein
VSLATAAGQVVMTARFLIDAGGRAAPLARQFGARRHRHDRLACGWVHGQSFGGNGLTFVEAVEDGWYSAPLPNNRRVLAFHTDANLPAQRSRAIATRCLATRHPPRICVNCWRR